MKYVTTIKDLLNHFILHKFMCKHKGCSPLSFEDFTSVFIESNYTDLHTNAFRNLTKLVKKQEE
tara:strand:- start:717 stop:908 length:192 start_codon:yes stop_codon:yes gene_type:complete